MLKILAIDTATDACSAALLVDQEISDSFIIAPKEHTTFILSMVKKLLANAQLNLRQLDAIAYGMGPGSFTGIRMSTSITQGLAAAFDLPVIGISTLRTLAAEIFTVSHFSKVVVIQDARMQEVYYGEYAVDQDGIMQPVIADCLVKPEKINLTGVTYKDFVGIGSGFFAYNSALKQNVLLKVIDKKYVNARYMLPLAAYEFSRGKVLSAKQALPIYLREQVAKVPI